MKRNAKVLALMALMAAGTASAATEAGTPITNTASAAFDIVNPDGTTSAGPGATSNTVKTVVSSVPNFTIELSDTAATSTTNYAEPAQTKSAVPGTTVSYLYTLTNTGNVPNESYTLGNTTPSATNGGTGIQAGTPTYYKDDGDDIFEPGADDTVITGISGVAPGFANAVKFWVAYPIAGTLANDVQVGTSPVGTRVDNPGFADENSILPVDANNSNVTTVYRTTSLLLGPINDSDGNGLDASGQSIDAPNTPEGFTVKVKTNDSQTASGTTIPAQVTFTNTLTNTSNVSDTYTLTATTAGLPDNTTDNTTVRFTDLAGNPITEITVGAGQTASFLTIIDYPNTGLTNADFVVDSKGLSDSVTVTATSKFDPSVSNTTTNEVVVTILSGAFGDNPGGGSTTPGTGVVNKPVTIPANTDPATCTTTVATTFPMLVANTGTVANTYSLAGTVTVTLVNGNPQVVPVTYYATTADATAQTNPITSTGSIAPGGTKAVYGVVLVPCGTASGSYTLTQTATGSDGTKYTDSNDTITVGTAGELVLGKFVEGGTGGTTVGVGGATPGTGPQVVYAPNNLIDGNTNPSATFGTGTGPQVTPIGLKDPATGDISTGLINYVIIGKNFYNAEVRNVILTDSLDLTKVNYVSGTCQVWSDPNKTPEDYTDDVLDAGKTCKVDPIQPDGTLTAGGVTLTLASGQYVRMNIAVTVK